MLLRVVASGILRARNNRTFLVDAAVRRVFGISGNSYFAFFQCLYRFEYRFAPFAGGYGLRQVGVEFVLQVGVYGELLYCGFHADNGDPDGFFVFCHWLAFHLASWQVFVRDALGVSLRLARLQFR